MPTENHTSAAIIVLLSICLCAIFGIAAILADLNHELKDLKDNFIVLPNPVEWDAGAPQGNVDICPSTSSMGAASKLDKEQDR